MVCDFTSADARKERAAVSTRQVVQALNARSVCLSYPPLLSESQGGATVGDPAEIVLDWPAWLDLHGRAEDVDRPLEIDIVAARWWEYPRLAVSHPDPTV